jgi:histidine triad (HIT) family protein
VTHEPPGYDCPFCRIVGDRFGDDVWTAPEDVVFRGEGLCAWIAPGQFSADPAYLGHVIVVAAEHHENLYDMPDPLLGRVGALRRRVALAFKRLGAEGTSTRQHNEPAGNQDVWHYHEHVLPRYADDRLYRQDRVRVDAVRRAAQAERVRGALAEVLDDLPLDP